jgi:hypothetical protein
VGRSRSERVTPMADAAVGIALAPGRRAGEGWRDFVRRAYGNRAIVRAEYHGLISAVGGARYCSCVFRGDLLRLLHASRLLLSLVFTTRAVERRARR